MSWYGRNSGSVLNEGYQVTGSDIAESAVTSRLISLAKISFFSSRQKILRVLVLPLFPVRLREITLKLLQHMKNVYRLFNVHKCWQKLCVFVTELLLRERMVKRTLLQQWR